MDKKSKSLNKALRGEEVDLEEMNVILRVPRDAVSLELIVGIFDENGKLRRVSSKLSISEISDARQAFLENVEDGDEYDARFVITEEGRRHLEQLRSEGGIECEQNHNL